MFIRSRSGHKIFGSCGPEKNEDGKGKGRLAYQCPQRNINSFEHSTRKYREFKGSCGGEKPGKVYLIIRLLNVLII
jgi:hypothetical protein